MPATNHDNSGYSVNLEPRVAKLETGLEILTRDVTTLASVVREQSRNIEGELQKLTIAVTQASGPKKTEWTTLIASAMLAMAIGSAIFWPLNQTAQNNKVETQKLHELVSGHISQPYHPVTGALLQQIDARLNKLEQNNDERNRADLDKLRELEKRVLNETIGK